MKKLFSLLFIFTFTAAKAQNLAELSTQGFCPIKEVQKEMDKKLV